MSGVSDTVGGLFSSLLPTTLLVMLRVLAVSVSAIGNAAAVLDALSGETLAVPLLSLAGGCYFHSSTV